MAEEDVSAWLVLDFLGMLVLLFFRYDNASPKPLTTPEILLAVLLHIEPSTYRTSFSRRYKNIIAYLALDFE